MKLTILGCSGSFPGAGSHGSACSSYLVEADGFRLLLEFGTGAVGALQRHGVLHAVDAVVLSHLHLDHCSDAATYQVVRKHDPRAPFPVVPLYGPAGTLQRLAAMSNGAIDGDGIADVTDVFDVRALADTDRIGPFAVRTAQMNHPVPTLGVRLEHAGKVVAYSADTGPTQALVELATGADLLLCEASYDADVAHPANVHLTGTQAGEHATAARAGAVVLTHLVPEWVDTERVIAQARAAYSGPLHVATPDTVYAV